MKKFARLCRLTWQQLTQYRPSPRAIAVLVAGLFLSLCCDYLLASLRFGDDSAFQAFARFLSRWGDFYTGCLMAVVGLFLAGLWQKKKQLQYLALAMLLSGALAGVTATTLRFFSGRPRPSALVADGLYGPRFEKNKHGQWAPSYNFNSFPSAHAATAMGTAAPALILQPAIGVPLTAAAVLVGWSRFQLRRHNPSDIYVGFLIGALFGVAAARATRSLLS